MKKYENNVAPVQEGDVIEVEIVAKGIKGDGIAKIENFVIIVKDVEIGDKPRVSITKVLRNMAFAEKVQ